jgi:hypothetical protein
MASYYELVPALGQWGAPVLPVPARPPPGPPPKESTDHFNGIVDWELERRQGDQYLRLPERNPEPRLDPDPQAVPLIDMTAVEQNSRGSSYDRVLQYARDQEGHPPPSRFIGARPTSTAITSARPQW